MPKKIVKLVHLVGFIIKKFVTMHGHVNVKKNSVLTAGIQNPFPPAHSESVWRLRNLFSPKSVQKSWKY